MCQYSADEGEATDWHMIHLGHLALSGAGLLFTEATAVAPEGRISAADPGLWSDPTQAAPARVIAAIRKHAPIRLAIQLAHAGRKASSQKPWEGGASIAPGEGGCSQRPILPACSAHGRVRYTRWRASAA